MSNTSDNKFRTSFFKKDASLEFVLKDLNAKISKISVEGIVEAQNGPIILIMGCPRAGSTVLLQWMASLNIFSYPSNLIARFYSNPYIGIRVQQALLEMDPLNQIGFNLTQQDFKSNLGKTIGALEPSEYWYYWRQYFQFDSDRSELSKDQLNEVDAIGFLNGLKTFEVLTGKPLALKGMLLNYHIDYLFQLYPKFIFVNLIRDPFYNAQSLLLARENYFNDINKWYSFKPPEYDSLKKLDPISQVAGQVVYMQREVKRALSNLPTANVLEISYRDFCLSPQSFFSELQLKFKALGKELEIKKEKFKNKRISHNNTIKLNNEDAEILRRSLNQIASD